LIEIKERRKEMKYVSCLFLALAMSGSLMATTLIKENDESILKRAEYIAVVVVERIDTLLEKNNTPFEYASLRIAKLYKNNGNAPLAEGEKIVVRQIGGTVGGITVDVEGLAKFVKDSQMFLSLNRDSETGYYYVTASVQGSYYMVNNTLVSDTRSNGLGFAKLSSTGELTVSAGEVKEMSLKAMEEKIRKVAASEAETVEE